MTSSSPDQSESATLEARLSPSALTDQDCVSSALSNDGCNYKNGTVTQTRYQRTSSTASSTANVIFKQIGNQVRLLVLY